MALTLPTPADLDAYRAAVSESDALILAADLFTLATGITDTPTDPLENRLVTYAILDMAWFLIEDHDNREAEFSPFSSERIGSYSYSKSQGKIENSESTGVRAFDLAVAYFTEKINGTTTTSDTEWVFVQGYHNPEVPVSGTNPDTDYVISGGSITVDADGFPVIEVEE